jgi:hypothetical protein
VRTARVRILVAITDDGCYVAEGYSDTTPKKLIDSMKETLHNHMTPPIDFYWIEADVPVPAKLQPKTITYKKLAPNK